MGLCRLGNGHHLIEKYFGEHPGRIKDQGKVNGCTEMPEFQYDLRGATSIPHHILAIKVRYTIYYESKRNCIKLSKVK